MADILVIADDFTGANDTGALLRQRGFNTFSSFGDRVSENIFHGYEAVCVNTDSRSAAPQEAKTRVYRAAMGPQMRRGMLISKRIDSTLRGNIGKEIEGVLEAVPKGYKAVVVPAGPRAGRICVGGYVLVDGVPLEKSSAARDPRTPVAESKVVDIIRKQTDRQVDWISLEEVHRGADAVAQRVVSSACSIVVADAADMDDIRVVARGCTRAGIPIVCVDPGDFTLEMASFQFPGERRDRRKNLLVVGSPSKISREQLDYMQEHGNLCLYPLDLERMLQEPEREARKVRQFFQKEGAECENLCITTAYSKRLAVTSDSDGGRKMAEQIADSVAGLALFLVKQEEPAVGLIYLCGGDMAKAFADTAGMEGVEPLGEISPLAVYGIAAGGALSGMKILTKGGMIGDRETLHKMLSCVDMINRISVEVES